MLKRNSDKLFIFTLSSGKQVTGKGQFLAEAWDRLESAKRIPKIDQGGQWQECAAFKRRSLLDGIKAVVQFVLWERINPPTCELPRVARLRSDS